MKDELVTIKLPKCVLRLYPSEIKPYLPPEVLKVGLQRGKHYKRTEAAYNHTPKAHKAEHPGAG